MLRFGLGQEEKKILKISHIGWISVTYSILPFIMLSAVTSNANIIKIGKLDSIVALVSIVLNNIVDGVFFEDNWYKFFKKYLLVLFLGFIPVIIFGNIYIKMAFLSVIIDGVFFFSSSYGWLHNEIRKSKLDIAYTVVLTLFNAIFILFNICNDIIISYYLSIIIVDLIWFPLELILLLNNKDKERVKKTNCTWREFLRISLKSIKRKSGSLVYDGLMGLSSLILITTVREDFALVVYLILSKVPIKDVISCFITQLKRVLLCGINVRCGFVGGWMFVYLLAESMIVSLIALIINQRSLILNWGIVSIMLLSWVLSFGLELLVSIKQLFLEFKMVIKPVFWCKLFLAVVLIGWRYLIKSSEFVFMAEIVGYFLINFILSKYINNIERSNKNDKRFEERVTK